MRKKCRGGFKDIEPDQMTHDGEIWKPLPRMGGWMASSEGRIRDPSGDIRMGHIIRNANGRLYKTIYVREIVGKGRRGTTQMTARMVAAAFLGLRLSPDGSSRCIIDHVNGNPLDDRPANLRICRDRSEPIRAGHRKAGRKIKVTDMLGNVIAIYDSQLDFMRDWGISNPGTANDYLKDGKQHSFRKKYVVMFADMEFDPNANRLIRSCAIKAGWRPE
jgi:hypothetical protein